MMQDHAQEVRKRVKTVFHDLKAEISPLTEGMIGDVEYVLHLAAGSHVDRSIEFPMEFVMDNVVGTTNLLQWSRTLKNLQRFVYFSTDEVFGPAPPGVNYKEYDRYNSTNPYSASKASSDHMVRAYHDTYKLPIVISNCSNNYGSFHFPEKLIPLAINNIKNNKPNFGYVIGPES
jgi:dTDP-glucose 4,6-dehydratase